jgi:FHS family Na+ dependent glucose MFS transporter 1
VFLFVYVGAELGFGGWIHTYAGDVGFSDGGATAITAAFWASFSIGRVISIGLAHRLTSWTILVWSCWIGLAGGVALVAGDGEPAAVWTATVVLGLALAPQFAMAIAYAGEREPVSGATAARLIAAAGLGGLVLPWVVGQVLDAHGPAGMPWTVLLCLATLVAWLPVVSASAGSRGRLMTSPGRASGT